MAKEDKKLTTEEIYASPIPNILELTLDACRAVAASGSGQNPNALKNAVVLREKKKRIYDKNGYTNPNSAQALLNESQRPARHSRVLARNIDKNNKGQIRPRKVDAHHIVACEDYRAKLARGILFKWCIGINDADNGVYLPRYCYTIVACLPNAVKHQNMHTDLYYISVNRQFMFIESPSTAEVRNTLRAIKAELIAGTFPF